MTKTFEDAFNLLCGDKIGSGIHRDVFECRISPQYVVKVENSGEWRFFANVHEMKFWSDNQFCRSIAQWLAPCYMLSPDGRILLQHRASPLRPDDKLPDKLPAFLTDVKRENFGRLDNRIVCVDYASTIDVISTRLRKVNWS